MRTPDLTQRVIGYRGWTVEEDYSLWPVTTTAAGEWLPGPMKASCWRKYGGHHIPCLPPVNPSCECGFYALHTLDRVENWAGSGNVTVQGIVTGWGRLANHDEGFRAERIEIMAIICPDNLCAKVMLRSGMFGDQFPVRYREVAKRYNVPLVRQSNAESYALEFGSPMPQSLMPSRMHHIAYERGYSGEVVPGKDWHELRRDLFDDKPAEPTGYKFLDELDPNVPEAMAGLYDIYVPNMGDLLVAVIEPPTPTYVGFPEDPIIPSEIDPMMATRLTPHIATNGKVAYLPEYMEGE
jgi:hypothetical protein